VMFIAQVPHWRSPPQPSPAGPHWMPSWAQVFGVHIGMPHTLGTPPPPQVWPIGQLPHWMMLPQPSFAGPQVMFCWAQVFAPHGGGVQTDEARSKIMNSSSFSCGVNGVPVAGHSEGKTVAPLVGGFSVS